MPERKIPTVRLEKIPGSGQEVLFGRPFFLLLCKIKNVPVLSRQKGGCLRNC